MATHMLFRKFYQSARLADVFFMECEATAPCNIDLVTTRSGKIWKVVYQATGSSRCLSTTLGPSSRVKHYVLAAGYWHR
jgi:hypothetical protein